MKKKTPPENFTQPHATLGRNLDLIRQMLHNSVRHCHEPIHLTFLNIVKHD